MTENIKIIDYYLFEYIKDEVLKRYPMMMAESSSLGQGKLRIEDRWIRVYLDATKRDLIVYYQGQITLQINDIITVNHNLNDRVELLENNKWKFKNTITHESGNRGQSDAAVFDAVKYMIDFYLSITSQSKKTTKVEKQSNNIVFNTIRIETNSLKELLNKPLSLPLYQRAYEWETEHVKALLDDTYEAFSHNKTYVLGTIILHQNDNSFDIVDGQQRLITVSILFKDKFDKNKLLETEFDNLKSQYYIQNTNKIIEDYLKNKDKDNYLDYLQSDKVKLNVLYIPKNQLQLAFTFFDSLNSKGMPLSDYDLLKAHHLMFIPENQENLARKHNDEWQCKDAEHKILFDKMLRQIRIWSRGHGVEGQNERAVFNEFVSAIDVKDLCQEEHILNRYMQPNIFRSWSRENDNIVLNMKYPGQNEEDMIPMQISQTIEGGDAFFLYAKRYHKMYKLLFENHNDEMKSSAISFADELSKAIDNDYLRNAYKTITMLYYDKFGENRLIEISIYIELLLSKLRFPNIEKVGQTFIRQKRVNNYVNEQNIVSLILNSSICSHVLSQINDKIGNISFCPSEESHSKNAQERYKEQMIGFYKKYFHTIPNESVKAKVKHLYQININQEINGI